MPKFSITRYQLRRIATSDKGTFGVLLKGETPLCVTCEDPWNHNAKGVSCIPAGIYTCLPHTGAKYHGVWKLDKVPGRSAILIHNGNTIRDTEGCILVGQGFSTLHGLPAVTASKDTLTMLRMELPKVFELQVINAFGGQP